MKSTQQPAITTKSAAYKAGYSSALNINSISAYLDIKKFRIGDYVIAQRFYAGYAAGVRARNEARIGVVLKSVKAIIVG